MNNPYGAVPEALKDTRMTLRDVMGDYLQNKVLEGRMNLEAKKAETETALVNADVEKSRLADLRDISKMRMAREMETERQNQQNTQFQQDYNLRQTAQDIGQNQFQQSYGLQERGQELTATAQQNANAIAQGQLGIAGRQVAIAETADRRAAAENARKNQVKPLGQWLKESAVDPTLVDTFLPNADFNQRVTRADFDQLKENGIKLINAHPAYLPLVQQKKIIGRLDDLNQEYLKATPQRQQEIITAMEPLKASAQRLQDKITYLNAPSPETTARLMKAYDNDPNAQTKYPDVKDYVADIYKMHGKAGADVGQYDPQIMKVAGMKINVSPTYSLDIKSMTEVVAAKNPQAAKALVSGVIAKEKAGDFLGAHELALQTAAKYDHRIQQHITPPAVANGQRGSTAAADNPRPVVQELRKVARAPQNAYEQAYGVPDEMVARPAQNAYEVMQQSNLNLARPR